MWEGYRPFFCFSFQVSGEPWSIELYSTILFFHQEIEFLRIKVAFTCDPPRPPLKIWLRLLCGLGAALIFKRFLGTLFKFILKHLRSQVMRTMCYQLKSPSPVLFFYSQYISYIVSGSIISTG